MKEILENNKDSEPLLVFGLGNPGSRYSLTRHNIGFLIVDKLAERLGVSFKDKDSFSVWGEKEDGLIAKKIILVKPQTFMNRSGHSVRALLNKYQIDDYSNFLVISDDADLDFGRFRLRLKGSSGGHRGLQSIMESLQSSVYPRLRVGVGRDLAGKLEDFVLEGFTKDEVKELPFLVEKGADIVWDSFCLGFIETMNKYNG